MIEVVQKKMTADEALDVLTDRSKLHKNMRTFFGAQLTDELIDILENEEIFELDAMLLQGDLTVAEMDEYLMVLPSYHSLQKRINEWADKLIKKMTGRLEATLRESVDKRGKILNTRGLIRMHKDMYDIIESCSNENCGTKRNALVHHLENYLGQALAVEIWYRITTSSYMAGYRPLMEAFLTGADQQFLQKFGHSYPGIISLKFLGAFRQAYSMNQFFFNQFLSECEVPTKDEELEAQVQQDFVAINELSHFRSIDSVKRQFSGVSLEIYSDRPQDLIRSAEIAFVKISFPGADPGVRLRKEFKEDGIGVIITQLDNDAFHFTIDRANGELILAGSAIALDKQMEGNRGLPFINRHDFLVMKATIYRILREYLEGKQEDIKKVFFTPTAKTDELQEETKKEITQVLIDNKEADETGEEPVEPTKPYTYQPFEKMDPETVAADEKNDLPKAIEDIRLDGVYKEELVIAALTRITKIPPIKSSRGKARGKGSHVVMLGLNGARYPLPSHAGKDLSPTILKRCLQHLEIPYSVFKSEY